MEQLSSGASIRQGLFIKDGRLIQTLKCSWDFVVQSVELCNANAEAMGSNPVEVRNFFFGFICNCSILITTAAIICSFKNLYFRSSVIIKQVNSKHIYPIYILW